MTFIAWMIAAFFWGILAGIAITKNVKKGIKSKRLEELTNAELLAVATEIGKEMDKRCQEAPFEEFM
jgi:hypothetical protein